MAFIYCTRKDRRLFCAGERIELRCWLTATIAQAIAYLESKTKSQPGESHNALVHFAFLRTWPACGAIFRCKIHDWQFYYCPVLSLAKMILPTGWEKHLPRPFANNIFSNQMCYLLWMLMTKTYSVKQRHRRHRIELNKGQKTASNWTTSCRASTDLHEVFAPSRP